MLSSAGRFFAAGNFCPYLIMNRSCVRTCLSPDLFSVESDQRDSVKSIATLLSHLF